MPIQLNQISVFQRWLLPGVVVGIVLVSLGWILVPAVSLLSVIGAYAILLAYGLVGYFVPPRLDRINPQILEFAAFFGGLAGLVFVSEILLEYKLLPDDNTLMGLIEFGIVFFLYFLAGLKVAHHSHSLRDGVLTAAGSGFIGSLLWLIAILLTFFAFRGTIQQDLVFLAEGVFDDFTLSGLTDFNVFIMEDFFGAAFFHLLLGPILAAILGVLGGLVGKNLGKLRK